MKKALLFCLMLGMVAIQSCKDECKDVICQNGGICNEGNCDCVAGFHGDNCETEDRAGLLGEWTGNAECPDEDPQLVTYVITAGSTPTEILIDTDGTIIPAMVTGINTFESDPIEFEILGIMVTTQADGSVTDGTLTMNISTEVEGTSSTCVFTGI